MYESASGLGVFSRSQPMGSNDDSMLDLGIRKTLDFNTPDSNSRSVFAVLTRLSMLHLVNLT